MTVLGVVFRPQLPPERLRPVAEAADEAGLDELWLWEDCFLESGIASAAAALAWTSRLTVGVGLLPVALDWPPATAPAIFAGAVGPRTLRLSGEAADGTILVAGTAEQVATAVRRWAEAGAGAVILQPTDDDPDPAGFVRFAAQEVKPLL